VDSRQHPAPRRLKLGSLPTRVDVYEVGPRDGLQNEAKMLSVDAKVRLIEALVAADEKRIEVTSFVSPKWIPQLADADELLPRLARRADVTFSALVPNLKGLQRAQAAGLQEAAVFISTTESHSKKNINMTVAEALASAGEVAAAAAKAGMRVRGYLSTVLGCPYEGEVPISKVVAILEALAPHVPLSKLALHMHDTRGTALANALVGLTMGITTFDASVGGLGGCPYAPGAAGNLATEDLVYMLRGLDIETGIDLDALVEAGSNAQDAIGRKLPAKYLQAALGEREKKTRQRAQT
jgi:hydroxymethylglutaryl-CoA lyase